MIFKALVPWPRFCPLSDPSSIFNASMTWKRTLDKPASSARRPALCAWRGTNPWSGEASYSKSLDEPWSKFISCFPEKNKNALWVRNHKGLVSVPMQISRYLNKIPQNQRDPPEHSAGRESAWPARVKAWYRSPRHWESACQGSSDRMQSEQNTELRR